MSRQKDERDTLDYQTGVTFTLPMTVALDYISKKYHVSKASLVRQAIMRAMPTLYPEWSNLHEMLRRMSKPKIIEARGKVKTGQWRDVFDE